MKSVGLNVAPKGKHFAYEEFYFSARSALFPFFIFVFLGIQHKAVYIYIYIVYELHYWLY